MRRKITVYGLRFYETTFWNRLNTGFLEPAVATALTACGIETHGLVLRVKEIILQVATALTACGIETLVDGEFNLEVGMLQRRLPLAVLKRAFSI